MDYDRECLEKLCVLDLKVMCRDRKLKVAAKDRKPEIVQKLLDFLAEPLDFYATCIANTNVSSGSYAWHCKCRRFLKLLCLALQMQTCPWVAMPGTANTDVSLGPHCCECLLP